MDKDKHEWKHHGRDCFAAREGNRAVLAVPTIGDRREEIAAAEILNLAGLLESKEDDCAVALFERDIALKKVRAQRAELVKEVTALTTENRRLRAELAKEEDERDALKLTAEEGQEIIAELSMALAILTGDTLSTCDTNGEDCRCACPGHLSLKAGKVVEHALAAYVTLQEGNRAAVERVRDVELLLDNIREGQSEASKPNEQEAEILAILRQHRPLVDLGQAPQSPTDTLLRIIRERLKENRSKCLELAEKAGEIRELQALLEVTRADRDRLAKDGGNLRFRNAALVAQLREEPGAKLLALLDSEEPPSGLEAAILAYPFRGFANGAWRWLREQVHHTGAPGKIDDTREAREPDRPE